MVRWLVAGAAGMLGQDLVELLRSRGEDVLAADRATLDITDAGAAARAAEGADVVVNCAAWTAVDLAETREADAFRANAVGAAVLARAADRAGARIVQVSTDYVFAGDAQDPYEHDEPIAPLSAYGRTKAAGEWAVRAEAPDHLIVRTAWVYGAHGACFPKTIARVASERGALDVVDDQVGQPTWTRDLADLVLRLVEGRASAGTYHGTSSGSATWYDFARAVVGAAGLDPAIVSPSATDPAARPARRPAFSVLGHASLRAAGVEPIGPWEDRWRLASAEVLAG